ncbi:MULTISPECIES: response regulator transcription factor [Bacillus]|uniref:Alkaline phosphatase synthesis transcriptional regulatory protein PhoP n=2 Tax=Bacillus cereus group TaxID=86661 RepID=R8QXB2_BACCE|nr:MULTISPECIES: response regulator transcription factor [Bacillus cereus group]EOP75434.1 alkaline phosphatase synthesis transcriptional regulatory protein PhoP [Bacillus cereus VD118]SCB69193.1 Alkaline phosphatase synthesis transcriptional regulatory protein PhoP [Bacillus mycoides]
MTTILVLEDEITIRNFIVLNIKHAGFNVLAAATGVTALELLDKHNVDLILIDVMLPEIDGFQVCKSIRENNKKIGIIMLTECVQDRDKVQALIIGADDYMEKSTAPIVLTARVQSLLRRVKGSKENIKSIHSEPFRLNLQQEKLYREGAAIDLTPTEFIILRYLMKNKGKPISRYELLNEIWGVNYVLETKVINVNIRRLREKIEPNPSGPQFLQTVWGKGYVWTGGVR